MKVEVLKNQTTYDMAIQEYGSAEGIFLLFSDNPNLHLSSVLESGQQLNITSAAVNQQMKAYYALNGLKPANAADHSKVDILGTSDGRALKVGGKFIRIKINPNK